MNLTYEPKDLQDKLARLQNTIACWQKKESENKVVILQFEEANGNPKELFAIGIKGGYVTNIKTDYHEYSVINIYLNAFFHGMKCGTKVDLYAYDHDQL